MKAIVAVERNWGIGCNGKLLVHLPEDLKFFKEKTINKVVIMGRKTFESLPNKRPLPNRINIILTKNKNYKVEGAVVLNTIEDVLDYTKNMLSEDVFVIGGEKIYEIFLPYVDECFVTKINYNYVADSYFPNLDLMDEWEQIYISEEQPHFEITYHWTTYVRRGENDK